jgi:hypothetical protein
MAWALKFNDGVALGDDYIVIPAAAGSVKISIKLGADFPSHEGGYVYVFDGRPLTSTYYLRSNAGSPQAAGISNPEINGVPSTLTAVFSALAGDIISFDVSIGTSFHLFSRYTSPQDCLGATVEYVELDYGAGVVQRNDATASDHSITGVQPVLVDTIGSNDATGSGFDTGTNDYWIDLGGANPTGTIAYTMSGLTTAASGNIGEAVTGTIAPTMAGFAVSITGSVGDNPTGTIAVTMSGLTTAISGNIGEAVIGTVSSTMSGYTVNLIGNVGEAITGTIATTMSGLTIAASGTVATPATGTIAYTMQGMTVKASESTGGDRIYGSIAIEPIVIEQINVIPIVVITK